MNVKDEGFVGLYTLAKLCEVLIIIHRENPDTVPGHRENPGTS